MIFKKRPKKVLPEDLSAYVKGANFPENRGVAFVIGVTTLIATLLIAALLAVGIRAGYRAVVSDEGNDKTAVYEQKSQVNKDDKAKNGQATKGKDKSTSKQSSAGSQKSFSASEPRIVPRDRTMPNTGDTYVLPNTGDPGR